MPARTDLSSIGGRSSRVWDGIAQEVDIETGRVLFEWHSLEHVGIEESYVRRPDSPNDLYDYFHINSIDVDHDDNLIISSRNTCTVYKVERNSGEILWRLGGRRATSRWVRAPRAPGSTTPGATQTAPSPSSITEPAQGAR